MYSERRDDIRRTGPLISLSFNASSYRTVSLEPFIPQELSH